MEIYSVQSGYSHFIHNECENCAYSATTTCISSLEIFDHKINVPEYGNCFFMSLALELSYFSKQTIQHLGLSQSAPIMELVMKLREVIEEEWMGCQRHLYEEVLVV